MPRIAATLAGLMLMTVSIGVNIARYPVVWEMVGGKPAIARADAQSEPKPVSDDPSDSSETVAAPCPDVSEPPAVEPSPSSQVHSGPPKPIPLEPVPDYQADRYACLPATSPEADSTVVADTLVSESSEPTSPEESVVAESSEALADAASDVDAGAGLFEAAEPPDTSLVSGRLVPVVRSQGLVSPQPAYEAGFGAIVSLPPVDAATSPHGHLAESRVGKAVPFYPSTGID